MQSLKRVGIWMDHSNAYFIEFNADSAEAITEPKSIHQDIDHDMSKGENLMHNKQQHQQGDFYKKIGAVIKNYDEVLLFGPTDAKQELFNLLNVDQHFSKIKIEVKQADKMSENQEKAFVKSHFSSLV